MHWHKSGNLHKGNLIQLINPQKQISTTNKTSINKARLSRSPNKKTSENWQSKSTREHTTIPDRHKHYKLSDDKVSCYATTIAGAWNCNSPTKHRHSTSPCRVPQNEQSIWWTWRKGTHHDGTLQRYITKCSWTGSRNQSQSIKHATGSCNLSSQTQDGICGKWLRSSNLWPTLETPQMPPTHPQPVSNPTTCKCNHSTKQNMEHLHIKRKESNCTIRPSLTQSQRNTTQNLTRIQVLNTNQTAHLRRGQGMARHKTAPTSRVHNTALETLKEAITNDITPSQTSHITTSPTIITISSRIKMTSEYSSRMWKA